MLKRLLFIVGTKISYSLLAIVEQNVDFLTYHLNGYFVFKMSRHLIILREIRTIFLDQT